MMGPTPAADSEGRSSRPGFGLAPVVGLVVVLAGACGQGGDDPRTGAVDTEVNRLDTDGVISLGTGMAGCLRDIAGIDIDDGFLLAGTELPFDFDGADPAREQALVECFNGIDGIDGFDADDRAVLEVEVDG